MSKQKVYNYVMNTPHNTNPNILGSLLDEPTSWNDLTDKPFYEEVETVTILENQVCVGGTPNMVAVDTVFTSGNAVEIIYADNAYKCTAISSGSDTYVGNASLAGFGDDTGEPFFIVIAGENKIGIFCAESATVSVYVTRKTVHNLDGKYLYDIVFELEEDYKNATGSVPITTEVLHCDYYKVKEKLLAGDIVHACVKHRMIKTEIEFVAVCIAKWVGYVIQDDSNGEFISVDWDDDSGSTRNLAFNEHGLF